MITHGEALEFIRRCGLDPERVKAGAFVVDRDGIYASLFIRSEDGKLVLSDSGPATTSVFLPYEVAE